MADHDLATLRERIAAECQAFPGEAGIYAQIISDGAVVQHGGSRSFPTASAIKLAVLTTLMELCCQGVLSLDTPLMLRHSDHVRGSGVLQFLTPGLTASVRDWAFLMMSISDNLATNVLIDHIGLKTIHSWLVNHGFHDVQLSNRLEFDGVASDQHHFGSATPAGLNRLLAAVYLRQVVSVEACDEMMRLMDKVGMDRVGRYLPFQPFGVDNPESAELRLAGKTGSFVGTRVQTAVVWREERGRERGYIMTAMTEGNDEPERWSVDAPGVLLIGRLSRLVYDYVFLPEEG